MSSLDTNSLLLLSAIIVPLIAGAILLGGSRFNTCTTRGLSLIGFLWPLIVGGVLFAQFDPALAGGYNFELRLPTGLESIGIYLHLGLNGISMPLFLLAAVVGLAAGLYAMYSQAERLNLYLALLLIMLPW